MHKRSSFLRSLLILFVSLCCSITYALNIDKMIVFGDSLSDNGNIFSLTSTAHEALPIIPVIPKDPPYYHGRFSNGPVWVENLASSMNVPLVDYAYGGSWAESVLDSKLAVPFSLGMQVNFYLVSAILDFHKDQHLYVIWSGANDYVNGRSDPEYATSNTVAYIQNQLEWLIYYGAKNFLLLNIPNLGIIPDVMAKGPDFAAAESKLSSLHNEKFATMIESLQKAYPEVKFVVGDTTDYFNDIVTNPNKYLLKNVTQACYDGGYWFRGQKFNAAAINAAKSANIDIVNNPSLRTAYVNSLAYASGQQGCSNPDEYLFWDQLHPTRIGHQIISTVLLSILNQNSLSGQPA